MSTHKKLSQQQIKRLREISGPSNQIFNFLDEKEFELLRYIAFNSPSELGQKSKQGHVSRMPILNPEAKQVHASDYRGFNSEHEIAKDIAPWLMPKLEKLLGPHRVDFFAFQEAITPWKIHIDLRWNENEVPHRVVLIPLDVEPFDGPVSYDSWLETNTIVFNQRNFLTHYSEDDDISIVPNIRPCDDPNVEELAQGYHIDREYWERMIGHIPYEYAEGLTIERICPWTPRSIMYWDNTILHTSDNFQDHGIRTKKCFMVFTFLPE